MKTILRKDAGTLECPIIKNHSRRFSLCQFTLCYQWNRLDTLFSAKLGDFDCSFRKTPDWVELNFPKATAEGERFRIVSPEEASDIYRVYQDSPNAKPQEAVDDLLEILNKPLYAMVDTDSNTISEIYDNEELAKSMADHGNEGLYRTRFVVRNIRNGIG